MSKSILEVRLECQIVAWSTGSGLEERVPASKLAQRSARTSVSKSPTIARSIATEGMYSFVPRVGVWRGGGVSEGKVLARSCPTARPCFIDIFRHSGRIHVLRQRIDRCEPCASFCMLYTVLRVVSGA